MYDWHKIAFHIFDANPNIRFFMFNNHRRSRKTTWASNLAIRQLTKYKMHGVEYIGPTKEQAKTILWQDYKMFFRWIPENLYYKKNEQDKTINFPNNSLFRLRGADNPDSVRGIGGDLFIFDEWAVFRHQETIWDEIVRPILAENKNARAIFIFTPKGQNYCHKMWNEAKHDPQWFTYELKASSSNIITPDELERIKAKTHPTIYRQEYECEFIADEEMVLITTAMLDALKSYSVDHRVDRFILAGDPATGGDECVLYFMNNGKILDELILFERDEMKIVGHWQIFANKHNCRDFIIDSIGVGGGICSRLKELNYNVQRFDSRESSSKEKMYNKRTEAFWNGMEMVQNKEVPYNYNQDLLYQQLTNIRFRIVDSSGMVQIEPNETTKKRTGLGSDRAHAYIYGLYGLKHIQEKNVRDWGMREKIKDRRAIKRKLAKGAGVGSY
ncbi:MAG: terminase large subunit domain-containing protein [Candidatus Thorarchaeota archaeon]